MADNKHTKQPTPPKTDAMAVINDVANFAQEVGVTQGTYKGDIKFGPSQEVKKKK